MKKLFTIYIYCEYTCIVCVHITNIIKKKETINLRGDNGWRISS